MKTKVRCSDKMVFLVDSKTLEPKSTSVYDAYCFSDPEKDVLYINYTDWCIKRNAMQMNQMKGQQ